MSIFTVKRACALSAAAMVLGLSACGNNFREDLGLVGNAPDEFAIVKHRRLEMPASTAELPKPQPNGVSLAEPRPEQDAQRALSLDLRGDSAPSKGEGALVEAAGANQADPDIRARLEEEELKEPKYILDALLPSKRVRQERLDAQAEVDRLAREAKATKNPDLELPSERPTEAK